MSTTSTAGSRSPIQSLPRLLLRHGVEIITGIAVVFILQTGLVPFDFRALDDAHLGTWFTLDMHSFPFLDVVSNIFLYMPVAALIYWSLLRRKWKSHLLSILAAIVMSAILSGFVEWLQSYSVSRISSLADFISNIIGAMLGVGLAGFGIRYVPRIVVRSLQEMRARPYVVILQVYCLGLVFFSAMPYSFTFDAGRFKQTAQSSILIPFAHDDGPPIVGSNDDPAVNRARNLAQWQRMKRYSRWIAECASFTIVAWLLLRMLYGDYRFSRPTAYVLTLWLGGLLAFGLTILQIPIVTRTADSTDILFRWVGLIAGMAAFVPYFRYDKSPSTSRRRRRAATTLRLGCAAIFGLILYNGLIPFGYDFNGDDTGLWRSLWSKNFLPFMAYFPTRFDLMIDDLMEKTMSYAVLAGLLTACRESSGPHRSHQRHWSTLQICLLTAGVIEFAQCYMPVRITSTTDLILSAIGCLMGILAYRYLVLLHRLGAMETSLALQSVTRGSAGRRRPRHMTMTDELVASLFEESPEAPVEPSPTPHSTPSRPT